MADFFSRIFAIPSDVSSNYSLEELRAAGGGSNAAGISGSRKKGHSRTLTPLSLTDGNGTATSATFAEGTLLSYGSDSVGSISNTSRSEQLSSTSTSTETMEEHLHHHDDRRQHAPPTVAPPASSRGRQRRNDASVHRSASEPRHKHRSSSMASSSQTRRTNTNNAGVGIGGSTHSRNTGMQLQLNSPTKRDRRHRSLSKMGARSAASSHKDPTLTRVNSWSSGEREQEGGQEQRRRRSRSSSKHRKKDSGSTTPSSQPSSAGKKIDYGTPTSQQKTVEDNLNLDLFRGTPTSQQDTVEDNLNSMDRSIAAAAAKKVKKKEKRDRGWRSKLAGGMKKHLSPGTTTTASGTPPQKSSKGNTAAKGRSKKKHQTNNAAAAPPTSHSNNRKKGPPGENGSKLNLSPQHFTPQPINVGDSIVISQQFLEEGMEMSVLTIPRELVAMNEEALRGDNGGLSEFDKTIQEVGQRTVLENDHVQAFLERQILARKGIHNAGVEDEIVPSSSTGVSSSHRGGPVYPKISEYASRILEEGIIYQSYSQDREEQQNQQPQSIVHCDNGEDGMEVRPAQLLNGKHSWPCDPSADGYSPQRGGIPPPPPPPPQPTLLPPRHNGGSLQNNGSYMPSLQQHAAVPHWNTPVNSNSESIATSYDDPPGTLVTSPTLGSPTLLSQDHGQQHHHSSRSDPPGNDSYHRPFDEGTDFCNNNNDNEMQHPPTPAAKAAVPQRSNKAVTFSLPPLTHSSSWHSHPHHPPAPPFMGPPLDYYYSMERSTSNPEQNWMSSSPLLLPPIIELWASVESADNVPGGDIIGGDIAANTTSGGGRWDTKRENELLGEDLPLHVSEGWIEDCDKEDLSNDDALNKEDLSHDALNPAHVLEGNTTNSHEYQKSRSMGKKVSSTSSWEDIGALPDDEYFDDILNCGEEFASMNVNNDQNGNSQAHQSRDVAILPSIPSNDLDVDEDDNGDDDGANVYRHRSTWNSAYKPPKLSLSDAEDSFDPMALSPSSRSSSDNWQRLVRHRANAAIAIQKSVRGLMERQRIRLLLESVLVIQPFIRRFLSRKRYSDYLKVKRSYYPKKWRRSNMAVAI